MGKLGSNRQTFARFDQTAPSGFITYWSKEKTLNLPAIWSQGSKSGRQHRGVIANEGIACIQKLWQISEIVVVNRLFNPVHHQQTRTIASGWWGLGDQTFGQLIIEKVCG